MPKTYIKTDAHHHRSVEEPGEWPRICEHAARDLDLVLGLKLMAMEQGHSGCRLCNRTVSAIYR
jgi:hypothetical protein